MATYGELIDRIGDELIRDDLKRGGDLVAQTKTAIASAIREYQTRNWWFLALVTTLPTVAAQNFVTRPATAGRIDRVSIPAIAVDLYKEDLAALEEYDEPVAQTGQPESYAEYGAKLRLWPTPNSVFTIKIVGTLQAAPLVEDTDQNVWTNEAYDLIAAAAKKRLARFPLRDVDARALAADEENEAIRALNETNVRRLDGPVKPGW